jgi:hypothetical protein
MDELKDLFARGNSIMERGGQWTDKVYGKVMLTIILLKLFEPQITSMGVPMLPLYIIGTLGIFVLNFIIGIVDLKIGIWQYQNDVGWDYTPKAKKLVKQVDDIHCLLVKEKSG